jgi:hypothetical protein
MSTIRKSLVAGLVVLACGLSALAGTAFAAGQFSDVGESSPFYEDIEWMAQTGISEGYDDGTYKPGAPVTRQAMSAFLHRANEIQIMTNPVTYEDAHTGSATAVCPEGTEVIAGGGTGTVQNLFITDSNPNVAGTQWSVTVETDNNVLADFTVQAWAMCGAVDTHLV